MPNREVQRKIQTLDYALESTLKCLPIDPFPGAEVLQFHDQIGYISTKQRQNHLYACARGAGDLNTAVNDLLLTFTKSSNVGDDLDTYLLAINKQADARHGSVDLLPISCLQRNDPTWLLPNAACRPSF
jgi:hypothetical protein